MQWRRIPNGGLEDVGMEPKFPGWFLRQNEVQFEIDNFKLFLQNKTINDSYRHCCFGRVMVATPVERTLDELLNFS